MSKWENTPFKTIREAHDTATALGLNPTVVTRSEDERFDSFIIYEKHTVVYVAQAVAGGPVREKITKSKRRVRDPRIPTFKEKDRLLAGPWILSDHTTLEEVEASWRELYLNFDNVEVLQVVLYRIGADEYEYVQDASGVHQRVLHRRK